MLDFEYVLRIHGVGPPTCLFFILSVGFMFPGSTEAQTPVGNLGCSGNPKAKPTSLLSLFFSRTQNEVLILDNPGYPTRHQLQEVSESQKSKNLIGWVQLRSPTVSSVHTQRERTTFCKHKDPSLVTQSSPHFFPASFSQVRSSQVKIAPIPRFVPCATGFSHSDLSLDLPSGY